MILWGISALSHDASLAVVQNNNILFASHSERYSGIKNDNLLNQNLINDALAFGEPDKIVFYEKPLWKKLRQAWAGQYRELKSPSFKSHLKQFNLKTNIKYVDHHMSHVAAGLYTADFHDATVVVLDAIGEWETLSIWEADKSLNTLKRKYSQLYPHSVGLWYSAMTQRCGLKPNEEEYILMGMAALGDPYKYYELIVSDFLYATVVKQAGVPYLSLGKNNNYALHTNGYMNSFVNPLYNGTPSFITKTNLHRGALQWRPEITDVYNLAASVQKVYEDYLVEVARWCFANCKSKNLILMGGCALNCLANTQVANMGLFDNIWIMPNPGDAGSSLGAVAAYTKTQLNWNGPYLGHNIEGAYPHESALNALLAGDIIGVASGRAEFGPRALGHRSLLADPRGLDIKDRVNQYKKREMFRPFAPAILEEHVDEYFEMPHGIKASPYMQFVVKCRRPNEFPAIVHFDDTSRVQTVNERESPDFYKLIKAFYDKTGCPMLLNTSLNIKGKPLVNSRNDADEFEAMHQIKVFRGGD